MKKTQLFGPLRVENRLPVNMKPEEENELYAHCKVSNLVPMHVYDFTGANVLSDGTIFEYFQPVVDSFVLMGRKGEPPTFLKKHNWKGLLKIYFSYKKETLPDDGVYLLAYNANTAYFHWICETIPRMLALKEDLSKYTILLRDRFKDSFYMESLKLLGITKYRYLEPEIVYKVPRLKFPAMLGQKSNFNPEILKLTRDTLVHKVGLDGFNGNYERLYISRSKAKRRKVINEDEVTAYLEKRNFKCINFEDYTFPEQIRICSQAKVFISIHGAGLANILFMPSGGKVLEFRKFDHGRNYTYVTLSSVLNLDYYLMFCETNTPELSVQNADITVDMVEFDKTVKMMLGE